MGNMCKLGLPDLLLPCNDLNNYQEYENELFRIFSELYIDNQIRYKNTPVAMKYYPPEYNERSGFYHIICENYDHTGNEEDRSPNFRRCERIKWAKEIIENNDSCCDSILIWENERHGKRNLLIFCKGLRYVVVLSIRKNYLLLTTAYPVEREHTFNKLMSEYNSYKKQMTPSI